MRVRAVSVRPRPKYALSLDKLAPSDDTLSKRRKYDVALSLNVDYHMPTKSSTPVMDAISYSTRINLLAATCADWSPAFAHGTNHNRFTPLHPWVLLQLIVVCMTVQHALGCSNCLLRESDSATVIPTVCTTDPDLKNVYHACTGKLLLLTGHFDSRA
jgi:hypothetical protein